MNGRALAAAPPLVVAALATALALALPQGQSPRRGVRPAPSSQAPPEAPCAADVAALLTGLKAGDSLGAFKVEQLRCAEPRRVSVELESPRARVAIVVAAKGAMPHEPPRATERCGLFYHNRGPLPPPDQLDPAIDALAARVSEGEKQGLPAGW